MQSKLKIYSQRRTRHKISSNKCYQQLRKIEWEKMKLSQDFVQASTVTNMQPTAKHKIGCEQKFYDDGSGTYDCTKLCRGILSSGLLNEGLQSVLHGVQESANQAIRCKYFPKMTFSIMLFYILQRYLHKVCSPESTVFHHAWRNTTPEGGFNT